MDEARLLMRCGIRWLGFPLRLPVNTEDLSEDEAARIIRKLPPTCVGVLITYMEQALEVLDLCQFLGARAVQLHGNWPKAEAAKLRALAPDLFIIKSLVIKKDNTPDLLEQQNLLDRWVDGYITDTFDPDTGASGATGKVHDWSVSRLLIGHTRKPVILAGGLNDDNVGRAIRRVRPAGVDVHTGIERADGRKSPSNTRHFVRRAQKELARLTG